MKIIEQEIGSCGAAYFLEELAAGGALSMCLRTRFLSSTNGRWSVLLPENVPRDIYDFRTGGKFPSGDCFDVPGGRVVEVVNSDECLVSILLNLSGVSMFAFEAVNLRRSDMTMPWLSAERLAVLNETILLLQDRASANSEKILRSLQAAESGWYGIAVASEASKSAWLDVRQEWTKEDTVALADGARCVALRIYDGESFMLWRRE